jgi:sugar phosphate isomerase/epimerase
MFYIYGIKKRFIYQIRKKMGSRREFLVTGALASSAIFTGKIAFAKGLDKREKDTELPTDKTLKLGIAGYSFLKFDLEKSLAMMRRMDVHYLCIKDFHLPLDSTDAQIAAFHQTLAASNVKGTAVGPIYMKTKQEIDRAFDYAKRVGVDLMIGIPEPGDLPYVAQKCKEYSIRYAIHNHGPQDKLYPSATVAFNYIKGLDQRVGLCLDMGHDTRDGQDAIKDLLKYKDRVFDLHFKDVTQADAKGTTCELGRGVISIPGFMKALDQIKYKGVCHLEFEKDMNDPLAGIAESVGYFRGVADTIGVKPL